MFYHVSWPLDYLKWQSLSISLLHETKLIWQQQRPQMPLDEFEQVVLPVVMLTPWQTIKSLTQHLRTRENINKTEEIACCCYVGCDSCRWSCICCCICCICCCCCCICCCRCLSPPPKSILKQMQLMESHSGKAQLQAHLQSPNWKKKKQNQCFCF